MNVIDIKDQLLESGLIRQHKNNLMLKHSYLKTALDDAIRVQDSIGQVSFGPMFEVANIAQPNILAAKTGNAAVIDHLKQSIRFIELAMRDVK